MCLHKTSSLWSLWSLIRCLRQGTVPGVEDDLEGPELQALMALSTDPAKLELLSTGIAEILASRPSTLLHGDCRGDNVSTGTNTVTIVLLCV